MKKEKLRKSSTKRGDVRGRQKRSGYREHCKEREKLIGKKR